MTTEFVIENGVLQRYAGNNSHVVIPNGVTSIGKNAFEFSGIESVVIPDSVTTIGHRAFFGCQLTSVKIPSSVKILQMWAFGWCRKLQDIEFSEGLKALGDSVFEDCCLTEINLPEGLTDVGNKPFAGCSHLKKISLPSTLLDINRFMFDCEDKWSHETSLREIMVREGNPVYFSEEGLLYKHSDLGIELMICPPAKQGKVIVKEGTTIINYGAFSSRKIVNEIVLPSTLKIINGLGCHCDKIEIPANVENIYERGFIGKGEKYSGDGVYIKEFFVDNNNPYFVSLDGALYKKEEDETLSLFAFPSDRTARYTVPARVGCVLKDALVGSKLEVLVIPKELTKLPRKSELPYCISVEFESGYAHTTSKLAADFAYKIKIEDATDCAYIALYQKGKTWSEKVMTYLGQNNENTDNTVKEIIRILDDEQNEKVLVQATDVLLTVIDTVNHELVKAFYDLLYEKQAKKALKLLIDNKKAQIILLEGHSDPSDKKSQESIHPIENEVKTLWKLNNTTKKLGDIISLGIRYKDSEDICSDQVLRYVIAAYAEELDGSERLVSEYKFSYVNTAFNKDADRIAEALNLEDLRSVLETLAYDEKHWKDGYLIPFARFASSEQISKLISSMNKWESNGPRGRAAIIIARGGLMLSDTREAMIAVDKTGGLPYYASLRGRDTDVIRDSMLSDFGFNEDGEKKYDLGGNTVSVYLNNELQLSLFDHNAGKIVKSVSKKNSDPSLYDVAKADLADIRKNIRTVFVNRKKLLFQAFLSGKGLDPVYWKEFYQGNPVLAAMARLLVWQQDNHFFTLKQGKSVSYNEEDYYLDDKKQIKLAYPTEMNAEEIDGWQNYFVQNELKQPFAQVWEPAYRLEDIKEDRYYGCTLPILRFNNKAEHGIYMKGLHNYSEYFHVDFKDCSLDCEPSVWRFVLGETDDAVYELKSFKVNTFSRYANHIVSLLDKWTLEDRIIKDDAGIISSLTGCTIVQIKHYIEIAGQYNSTACQAVLLDYLNQNFKVYDPLAEYLLED